MVLKNVGPNSSFCPQGLYSTGLRTLCIVGIAFISHVRSQTVFGKLTLQPYTDTANVCWMDGAGRCTPNQRTLDANLCQPLNKPGFWARPGSAPGLSVRRCALQSFSLYLAGTGTSVMAQENLPPALEKRIAAGIQALKSGDLVSAEETFSFALRQGARHPLIYHNLGVIALLRGNHSLAVTRFRQALTLQPDNGSSRLLLGSSLLALRKNTEAVRELKRAVALLPDQPQAHLELGRAYEASGTGSPRSRNSRSSCS